MKAMPFINLCVLLGCFILLSLQYCGKNSGNVLSGRDTLTNNITLNYDSGSRIIVEPKIYNSYSIKLDASDFPKGVDTSGLSPMISEIVKAYFNKHVDIDIRRDSNIEATIQDTLFQNMRIGRQFTYKLLKPQVIQNTAIVTDKRRTRLYLGAAAGIPDNRFQIDLSSALIMPNERIIGLDYDLTSSRPTIERFRIRYMQKLSLRPP